MHKKTYWKTHSQFYSKAKVDIPELEDDMSKGNFGVLNKWLAEKIHKKGSLYTSGDELCKAVTGEPLNPVHFLNHLTSTFTGLYEL